MEQFYDHEDGRRLLKWAGFVVVLLGIFLLAKTLDAFKDWRTPGPVGDTIVVSGTGDAYATADIATFSFSVTADAKAVSDAQGTVNTKNDAIISALKDLGIDTKDIQTTDYSVYPKYTYAVAPCAPNTAYCPQRQVADGYTVTQSASVKVRKTDDAGKALAAVGDNGGTNISGLSFTVDDPTSVETQARDKAVTEARTKAKSIASSLGVSLGRVVDFSDGLSNQYPRPLYEATMSAGAVDSKASVPPTISLGQNKVTDTVSITYEIR
jgi:uncharacterized protein YggE